MKEGREPVKRGIFPHQYPAVKQPKKKPAPAEEPVTPKASLPKKGVIRLDDLLPRKTVKGGQQTFFGGKELNP
jgi:hypothetical protein